MMNKKRPHPSGFPKNSNNWLSRTGQSDYIRLH